MDDECRGVRQRRKQADPACCPVCGITVRANEIEQHYSLEVDRLHKLSTQKGRKMKDMPATPVGINSHCSGTSSALLNSSTPKESQAIEGKDCWTTYQRIKNNRSARLKLKNRKRKADDPLCPICNERIADDLNVHVELCLRRSERNGGSGGINNNDEDDDDDDSIDVEGESYEEYEWAGQTRIRASSLLEGGYSATGLQTSSHQANEDEDEDLNVDGDDAQIYGEPQYNERDIILPMADNNKKENIYLRNLVIGGPSSSDNGDSRLKAAQIDNKNGFDDAMEPTTSTSYENPSPSFAETEINCESTASSSKITIDLKDGSVKEVTTVVPIKQLSSTSATQNETAAAHVIEALKEKIREYEIIIKNKSKCLICMDEFRVPVVSICCWHVHCEECWLRTLGARKLCPQCNMITSPTDLRKIYM